VKTKENLLGIITFIALLIVLLLFPPVVHSNANLVYKDQFADIEFVFVKGGCYEMGDFFGDGIPEEKPAHTVCVDDFYIGKYEVTQAQWRKVIGKNPSHFQDGDDRNCCPLGLCPWITLAQCNPIAGMREERSPVDTVSWDDVQEFIFKLNRETGKNYRLPTEAEWEYAAKSGGKKERWSGTGFESELDIYAWYEPNAATKTQPVGQKMPNGIGLYDMSGNVWEWVQDRFGKDYYQDSLKDNPPGPEKGYERVLRGGSWYNHSWAIRTTYRVWVGPSYKTDNAGFRIALSIPKPPPEEKIVEPEPPPEPVPVTETKDIHFAFDKYNIRPSDAEILEKNFEWFKANPGKKMRIEGHCDERGTVEYNLVLGQKRADSAKAFLEKLGVDKEMLDAVSYGKERPEDPEHNEKAWAKNRRAHFSPIE